MDTRAAALRPFADQHTVRLTTFRRDGTPVGTAVSLAVDHGRAFVRTFESSGKFKRIRNNPACEVAPSTFGGRAVGPAIHGRLRVLEGPEARRARALIEAKHPWLHRLLVPLTHRLTRKRTVYLEFVPTVSAGETARAA